jgi:hypothetical protein
MLESSVFPHEVSGRTLRRFLKKRPISSSFLSMSRMQVSVEKGERVVVAVLPVLGEARQRPSQATVRSTI